ncbi:MAG: autoantigen p27 domain-containing protein [candidate division Zixibacteria bacterium]|nr:autoantigen p27 domain-containing protein [candidate division Zixibacteria bacterium]
MTDRRLIGTRHKYIKSREGISVKESLPIEILKEGEECPNCHFALFKKEDNEIFCSVCGYGKKTCT